ncbi:MAG: CRISPR-associated endonuclease/helicase Cas3 [Acidobacteriota bacterium]|nr:CRISPR-associated endonuclease/helicase Cas3 [Acidobacteriota bacterium]
MIDFDYCFNKLTDNEPFAWQRELFARLTRGVFPPECDIPTGLGKTSIIVIWLLALADDLMRQGSQRTIPLRLVYVVDRRVIVDQATSDADGVVKNLKEFAKTDEKLRQVYDALKQAALSQDNVVIALSTLRGEHADNREWCLDPSRPAIIVGTIDMIGSRLLFSAYGGVGESYKALQAGLLGQDSLIAVDEAHLSPAFMQTLRALRQSVRRKNLIKPFEVISLSATPAVEEEEGLEPFTLEKDAPEDLTNEIAEPRLNAEKKIEWKSFAVSKDLLKSKKAKELLRDEQAKEMANAAAQYKALPVSVLIFGTTVNLVKEIKRHLIQTEKIDEAQILLMVGGMRGFERDGLVENPVFKMFSPHRNREEQYRAYFLVATSCAEVGVNLDADFAVCDPTSADSFIQRLGRVNRFGNTLSVVTVVHDESLAHESEQTKATLETLKQLNNGEGFSASPLALRAIEFPENCYPPKPVCPPLDSARLDDWSMTSLKQNEFRRPLVSYWLRGVTENRQAETSLCWRADLTLANTDRHKIATVKTARVKSRECARESTGRAKRTILAIAQEFPEERAVVISASNEYEVCLLAELRELNERNENELFRKLMFATVVLPCEVGGLDDYGITVDNSENVKPVADVVEKPIKASKRPEWLRVLLIETEAGVIAEKISDESYSFENPYKDFNDAVKNIAGEDKRCIKQIKFKPSSETEEEEEEKPKERRLAYFIRRKSPEGYLPNEAESDDETEGETASVGYEKGKSGKGGEVRLEKHNSDVRHFAQILAEKLHLSAEFAEALGIAGAWHDKGKNRQCWQMAVGNDLNLNPPIAKSKQTWFNHKLNNYYRHEFGSLVEADADAELKQHPARDLILHLIATHHGYARPHFPERAFDKDNPIALNRDIAEAAMKRFAQLQIKFGWWQLAYLEAILKAADALASRAEARGEI